VGAHNAGNDAIMNPKAVIAMAHDKDILTEEYNGYEYLPAHMEDVSRDLPNKCAFQDNVILVAVDIEEKSICLTTSQSSAVPGWTLQ
jgi:hypothetical protein